MKRIVLTLLLWCSVPPAFAWECDFSKGKPVPFEEAYKNADIIFLGRVMKTLKGEGPPIRKMSNRRNGKEEFSYHYIDANAKNEWFDVCRDGEADYTVYIGVDKVWKNTVSISKYSSIPIRTVNKIGSGLEFEQLGKYLVFAYRDETNPDRFLASACARTKLYMYSDKDIERLDEIAKQNKIKEGAK